MNKAEVFRILSRQTEDVENDLIAGFQDPLLAHLQRQFAPFSVFKTFGIYDHKVAQLSMSHGGPFHPHSIEALLGIDAALQGKVERPHIEYSEDILEAIDGLKEKLKSLDLPTHIEAIILKRIEQLEKVVSHYSSYGIAGLNKAYEELLGAVELYPPQEKRFKKSFREFKTGILATILMINGAVAATNSTIDEGQQLLEHVSAGVAYIEDMRDTKTSENPEDETKLNDPAIVDEEE